MGIRITKVNKHIKRMNKKIKKLWLEALRSRKYKQGDGYLKDKDGKFCCLGVLCDIYAEKMGLEWEMDDSFDSAYRFIDQQAYLPKKVQEWAGLEHLGGVVLGEDKDGDDVDLTHLNDGGRKFYQIARIIEEKL